MTQDCNLILRSVSLLSLFEVLKIRRYDIVGIIGITLQGNESKGSSSRTPAMKKLSEIIGTIALAVLLVFSMQIDTADAYVNVRGYTKSNGTYVAPHVRSNPNGLKYDNYSYKPSQGLYNATYGTKGAAWDTPTYITDPDYYIGKALYQSGSASSAYSMPTTSSVTPTSSYSYTPVSLPSLYSSTSTLSSGSAPAHAYGTSAIWYCDTGFRTTYDSNWQKIGCEKIPAAPVNSYMSGADWYCKTGYKTIYDRGNQKTSCEQIVAPLNAYVSGSDWYCNNGYKIVFNSSNQKAGCEQVAAPLNAYVLGADWYCNAGYKTIYNNFSQKTSCEKVVVPANAYLSGSDWNCNSGYKTVYNASYQKIGCQQ